MTCYRPIPAYRKEGGGVAFTSKEGYVDRPLHLPCGQCIGCRVAKSREWAIRCLHESTCHDANSFITLTFDSCHLPVDGSLDVSVWQKFAKRMRKRVGPFRFFHVGEYGDLNFRPHYHALIFGYDFSSDRVVWKSKRAYNIYVSSILQDLWPFGFSTVMDCNFSTAAYCAKYATKKITGKNALVHYRKVDPLTGEVFELKPEYATMSRRPGVGAGWFEKYKDDVYPSDFVVAEGKKFRPPRFYDSKLEESELVSLKRKRFIAAGKHAKDLTPERLKVRERVDEAEAKFYKSVKGV